MFVPSKKAGSGSAPYGRAGRETGKSHPTSPILKGQVREPPDIAQPHRITHHGEDEIQLAGPVPAGFVFIPHIVFLKGEGKDGGENKGEEEGSKNRMGGKEEGKKDGERRTEKKRRGEKDGGEKGEKDGGKGGGQKKKRKNVGKEGERKKGGKDGGKKGRGEKGEGKKDGGKERDGEAASLANKHGPLPAAAARPLLDQK